MNSNHTPFRQVLKPAYTVLCAIVLVLIGTSALWGQFSDLENRTNQPAIETRLVGRAVLEAATFAPGPTSGTLLGSAPINGQTPPFADKQPIQGFSAVLDNGFGTFLAMSDNGFGSIENSADFNLRVYTIRPNFKTRAGGPGNITVGSFFELRDPDKRIPFAITNHFTKDRVLTGADFDIESMQRSPDGTFWFGDEFGPFLLHTDATGRVLEPPIALPDFDGRGEIRSPQNPFNEEISAIRIMNAVRAHARLQGNFKPPVFSPWEVMLDDANPNTFIDNRKDPPTGSGLKPASSEIFNVGAIQRSGYPVVVYTVNDKARMFELMKLGVNGIISDRPDLLRQAVEEFDANNDGTPGDFINADGLIDINRFDAQGHRGGRNLRPENTLPAMEVALDHLMSTLELDNGITSDRVPILDHDPLVQSEKCRRADGINLQDEKGRNTPWLAGLFWPYRVTTLEQPFRSQTSGGFEGMALSSDGKKLYPLLERPLTGGEANTLLIHEFDLASKKYTGVRYKYLLNPRGTNIGDFIMFTKRGGLIIERDVTQGDLNGFKAIYQIELPQRSGEAVEKTLKVDLLRINDPFRISGTGLPGDVGLGQIFAFPFTTIEDVIVIDRNHIGVLNDNNFPFSVGRHVGAMRPDDNEFIIIRLDRPLN